MLNATDREFHSMYGNLLNYGHRKGDRTGHGTLMLPGYQMRFDLSGGNFPALSTRANDFNKPNEEMCWFITGDSHIKYLRDRKNGVWDSWFIPGTAVYEEPVYRALSLPERLKLVVEETAVGEIESYLDNNAADYNGTVGTPGFEFTTDQEQQWWKDGSFTRAEGLFALLEKHQIPAMVLIREGVKVGLNKRLSRIAKEDLTRWNIVYPLLVDGHAEYGAEEGSYTKVMAYDPELSKFGDLFISNDAIPAIMEKLDELLVPAYNLLDADIGKGGYGPQWRKWQDTQLVAFDDNWQAVRDEYTAQGYLFLGMTRTNLLFDNNAMIFHREIDQLQNMIDRLKTNPDCRRNIVNACNPGRTWQAALPPCHDRFQVVSWEMSTTELERLLENRGLYQTYLDTLRDENGNLGSDWNENSANDQFEKILAFVKSRDLPTRALTMLLNLRSSDTAAGAVFNVAQYAFLTHAIAQIVNMEPSELVTFAADAHIYTTQIAAMEELLERGSDPKCNPKIVFKRKIENIDDLKPEDVEITGLVMGAKMHIPIAV